MRGRRRGGFPDQIKPTSLKILRRDRSGGANASFHHPDGQLVIEFTVSDGPEYRDVIRDHLGLVPGGSYSVEVDIIDVIEDRVDGIEVWKRGTPQAATNQPFNLREADKAVS